MEKCGILFSDVYNKDKNGCIKESNHYDDHVFIDQRVITFNGEKDENCNYGCWNKDDPCCIYQKLIKYNTKIIIHITFNQLQPD